MLLLNHAAWKRLSFAVVANLISLFGNPLDFHAATVSVTPAGTVKVLKMGWNIKKFYDPLSLN